MIVYSLSPSGIVRLSQGRSETEEFVASVSSAVGIGAVKYGAQLLVFFIYIALILLDFLDMRE